VLGVLAVCSACGTSARVVTSGTTTSSLALATYTSTVRVQPGAPASVSVSCHAGEQMQGGGFQASNLFEYAAYIEASYPSDSTTWTVTGAAPASFYDLEAEVYCASATRPVGMQIVHASGATEATAACPQNTVLLSGGFQTAQPISASQPLSNGWRSAAAASPSGAGIQAYALCAARHVQRGSVASATFNAHSTSRGDTPGSGEVTCPAGQVAAGGGFAGGDLILGSQTTGPSFAGWSIAAGGDADVTVSAVCVVQQGQ
jgi:hypothetical protein